MKISVLKNFFIFLALTSTTVYGLSLEEGFLTPPRSAKPHTWYHLMNGNVTKEGITCDFESLAKVGIGGVQMFDAGCAIPEGPLKFNSPEWFDMFKHAQKEAKRLGLEICIPNCSGWSSSGGPWNPPKNAMKTITTREIHVKGPTKFNAILPRERRDHGFYEDIAIIAYPTPKKGAKISNLKCKTLKSFSGLSQCISRTHSKTKAKYSKNQLIDKNNQIDLSSKLAKNGRLVWDVPAGNWTILRIGHICNGRCNHPASKYGKGLEVDKLSASAMDFHFNKYVSRLCNTLGINAKTDNTLGFNNILVDSYEINSQNWTQGLDKIFEKETGYSIKPYLPVFAGRVVDSITETERFLEDFRKVVADLFAKNYAGRLTELCHQHGLMSSLEPYGNSPADDLQYGQDIDIPMAEFWSKATRGPHLNGTKETSPHGVHNSRKAATLAHIWGRRYAATESFTANPINGGRWCTTPFIIKSQGDKVFAAGINRIIYHRFTHQPWANDKYLPGMTMGRWGMHFDRTQTWWKYVDVWLKYQTRCQWMLQEGSFNADILYFCGEQTPNDASIPENMQAPYGYDWDICTTKALLNLKVKNGRIIVPSGLSYKLLALPPSEAMSEKVLNKIGELISAGAKICCTKKPIRAPGLIGYPGSDENIRKLADEIWSKGVMTCLPKEAIEKLCIAPDFASSETNPRPSFIHRNNNNADWYFVALDNSKAKRFEVSFRQTGRLPEIWDAENGTMRAAEIWREENGRTYVTLDFNPSGSAFVVFKRPSEANHIVKVDVKLNEKLLQERETKNSLIIKKAIYGVLELNRRNCVNAAPYIKPGKKVLVKNSTFKNDPVKNKEKKLEVIYSLDNKICTNIVNESSYYTLPEKAKLISAWYGELNPLWRNPDPSKLTIDVTSKIASQINNNSISMRVDNTLSGKDLCLFATKKCKVTYIYNGKEITEEFDERTIMNIPCKATENKPLDWDWRNGKLMAWRPIIAELTKANGQIEKLTANPPSPILVSGAWEVAFPAGWSAPASVSFPYLISWTEHKHKGIKYFSGTATYTKKITRPSIPDGARLWLDLGKVCDFAEVSINGKKFEVLWKPPFRVDITDQVKASPTFDVSIKVTNLWPNRIIGDDLLYKPDCKWVIKNHRKEQGIATIPDWVKKGKKSPTGRHTFTTWRHWNASHKLLPSGMLGPVCFRIQEEAKLTP